MEKKKEERKTRNPCNLEATGDSPVVGRYRGKPSARDGAKGEVDWSDGEKKLHQPTNKKEASVSLVHGLCVEDRLLPFVEYQRCGEKEREILGEMGKREGVRVER